jgi:hypothetical protein
MPAVLEIKGMKQGLGAASPASVARLPPQLLLAIVSDSPHGGCAHPPHFACGAPCGLPRRGEDL